MVEVHIFFSKSTKIDRFQISFLVPGKEGATHKDFQPPALTVEETFIKPVNAGHKPACQ